MTKRPYSNRGQFANPENGRVVDIGHSSGNPLDGAFDDIDAFGSRELRPTYVTMSSREIAALVNSRHDKVKQSIERLAERGVIVRPPMGDEPDTDAMGRTRVTKVYTFSGERGKRDSIIVVAQLCPEFTANLVDRWYYLEQQLAAHQSPTAMSHEVTVTGLEPEALGQVGGVFKNVTRAANRDLVEEIKRWIDAKMLAALSDMVPRLERFVEDVAGDVVRDSAAAQREVIAGILDEALRRREARRQADDGIALPKMDLHAFRTAMGWTLEDVAKMIGATTSCVGKHDRGVTIPSLQFLDRYHKISGGKLTAEAFHDTHRLRKIQEGRWSNLPQRSIGQRNMTKH